jgi:hypothetical protein
MTATPPPMCTCGHWGYEHGMLDVCAVVGCDCGRFHDEACCPPTLACGCVGEHDERVQHLRPKP